MSSIENVAIFMSDGLRWDTHPASIRELGITFRTVASSFHTPTSIASMLSGQYLGNHDIRGFTDEFAPSTDTILDGFKNRGISDFTGNFNNEIYSYLLGRYEQVSLEEIEPPFCWFMRDPGGHAPYGGFDQELNSTESVDSYLKQHAGDTDRMWEDYRDGIDDSVDRFKTHILSTLRERGLLEETLVVFISDHGQLLGEHGHVGESYPGAPEIVYVPTTFIHPSLEQEESDNLFRHVDLPDTIAGYLTTEVETGATDGIDHTSTNDPPTHGLSLYDRPYPSFRGQFHYTLRSVWEEDAGQVFNTSSWRERIQLLGGFLTKIPAGRHLRRTRSIEGFHYLLRDQYSWGEPTMTSAEARELLDSVELSESREELDLNEAAKDNLEDLGYL